MNACLLGANIESRMIRITHTGWLDPERYEWLSERMFVSEATRIEHP